MQWGLPAMRLWAAARAEETFGHAFCWKAPDGPGGRRIGVLLALAAGLVVGADQHAGQVLGVTDALQLLAAGQRADLEGGLQPALRCLQLHSTRRVRIFQGLWTVL